MLGTLICKDWFEKLCSWCDKLYYVEMSLDELYFLMFGFVICCTVMTEKYGEFLYWES